MKQIIAHRNYLEHVRQLQFLQQRNSQIIQKSTQITKPNYLPSQQVPKQNPVLKDPFSNAKRPNRNGNLEN